MNIVKRYSEDIDSNFVEKMMKGKKWICSLHYKTEDIETTDGTKLLQRLRLDHIIPHLVQKGGI